MISTKKKEKKGLCRNAKALSGRNKTLKNFFRPKPGDPKKKRSPPTVEVFFVCITIPAEVGVIFDRTLKVFFLSSTSAQISMGGRLNLDGGTLNLGGGRSINLETRPPHPPYNLRTDYNTKTPQLSTLKGLFLPTYSDYRNHAQQQ